MIDAASISAEIGQLVENTSEMRPTTASNEFTSITKTMLENTQELVNQTKKSNSISQVTSILPLPSQFFKNVKKIAQTTEKLCSACVSIAASQLSKSVQVEFFHAAKSVFDELNKVILGSRSYKVANLDHSKLDTIILLHVNSLESNMTRLIQFLNERNSSNTDPNVRNSHPFLILTIIKTGTNMVWEEDIVEEIMQGIT